MPTTPDVNTLFYGDNLDILRGHVADASVDLVYLDPPFNSNATYNVLFKSPTGEQSQSQIEAFGDTWHWTDSAERAFDEVMTGGNSDAAEMLRAMRGFLKENDMMAYLAMMAVRLLELHRVLKPTGSLYLHCDPTASHYLRTLLDAIFGSGGFSTRSLGNVRTLIVTQRRVRATSAGYRTGSCSTRRDLRERGMCSTPLTRRSTSTGITGGSMRLAVDTDWTTYKGLVERRTEIPSTR
jgi:hypothetical protein